MKKGKAEENPGEGIASRAERLRRMNEDWQRLQEVRRARSADPLYEAVPGGKTGLLTRNSKGDYVIDHDLLREIGELETLAAKEFGSASERADGEVEKIVIEHVYSTDSAAGASSGTDEDQGRGQAV